MRGHMKKIFDKITTVFLTVLLFGGMFAGCSESGKSQDFNVKVVPATVKYKLDESVESFGDEVFLSAAASEYESTQVIITPERNITDLEIEITSLTNGKNEISAENIQLYWEHYIYLGSNDIKNSEKTGFTEGYYPDALVPYALRKGAGENRVKAGENQGIWITVKTDENTVAGTYKGTLNLKDGNYVESVPVTLKVYDFALSDENHFMTAFAIWDGMPDDMLFGAYHSTDAQISENYYEFMLDYRISPTHIPNMSRLTLDEQKETFLEYIKRENVGSLALPYTVTTTEVGFNTENMLYILRALAEEAVSNPSILDKAYAYFTFIDEPVAATYPRVKLVNETFLSLLEQVADEKLSASGLEETKAKFLDIECVNTTAYTQEKVDARLVSGDGNVGIDTWCPTFDWFNSEKYRYESAERLAAGDGVWWYGCVEPRNPFPTFHVNDHLMPQRFVSWMQMEYGIEGQLFWATNAYEQYSYEKYDYVYRDVWKDAVAFPSAPGDGYLTYPGYRYGQYSPIPTIRLDNFRAAQEDYEYLYLLKRLFEENKPAQISYDFNTYVLNLYKQLYQGVIARNDSSIFDSVRKELANLIELASRGIFVDMSTNVFNNNCVVTVYSESEIKNVTLNGKALQANMASGQYVFTGNFIVDSKNQYADIALVCGEDSFEVSRFTGGNYEAYGKFDSDAELGGVSVSKCNRLGNDDVKAELSDKAQNGKSLKVTYEVPDKPTLGYLPTVTVKNTAGLNFESGEIFRAEVYNESDRFVELSIMLTDGNGKTETLYKAYLKPGVWNEIEILASNADVKLLNRKDIREIRFIVESLMSEEDNMTLYFDNIFLSQREVL